MFALLLVVSGAKYLACNDRPQRVLLTHRLRPDGITEDSKVDGGWSGFGACSKVCGGGIHIRICTDPAPANGGKDCFGSALKACNTQTCIGAFVASMRSVGLS